MAQRKHEPVPPMDLANMRRQGVHNEINHLAKSANFLAAYEAGDDQALWQAIVYCAGHRILLWEWLADELVMPWQRNRIDVRPNWKEAPGTIEDWSGRPAMPGGE